MKKILFISPFLKEQELVEEVCRSQGSLGQYQFASMASFGQTQSWWKKAGIDLLVISVPGDELQSHFMTKLKQDVPRDQSLLVLCPLMEPELLRLSSQFKKMRVLKSPVDGFALFRAIVDLTTEWEPGQQQIHPRYLTEQEIQIQALGDAKTYVGVMKNLSVTGAYVEVETSAAVFFTGQDLKFLIDIPGQSPYQFEARVVWVKPMGQAHHGYGCSFLETGLNFQNMIKGN